MIIRLKFGDLLRRRGVTPNRLAKRLPGLSRNTVYALANPPEDRVRLDLDVLAAAMAAVAAETGEPVELADVLEMVQAPADRTAPLANLAAVDRAAFLAAAKPFDWEGLKKFTDPRAEDFAPVLRELREANGGGSARAERLSRLWGEHDATGEGDEDEG